jgi:ankyrin repeat protein
VIDGADCCRFQLARQLMDILCNPMRIMRPEDVDAFLEILPEELMQSYSEKIDMIKKNLAPASRDMALAALMWLHCAAPMRPAEFLYAVSRIGNSSSSVPTTEEILKMCYNLVVFDGGLEIFRFAHPSVHDFLSLQEGYGHDAHCKALDTCLDVWSGLSIPSDHPLYEYATVYWPLHLQNLGGVMKNPMLDQKFKNFSFAEKKTETVETVYETKRQWMIFSKSVPRQRKVTRFRLELSPNFESWMDEAERLCLSLQTNDPYRSLLLESVSIRKTPIFLACTFGLLRILEIWDDGTRNIAWAVKNKNKNYPFKLACKLGNVAIVEYLLGRGLSATNGDLVRSAENGRAAVVAILMKQTAVDINASHPSMWQFWRSQTALIAAAAGGYDSVVEVLLRSPHINPNIATPFGRTALIAAAEQGHDLVAKMLIAEGTVNVNLQDSRGRTALAAAVNNDHPAIVESLIALPQISTDRPDHKDDTPLHLAAKKGLLHMVSILLTNRRISLDRKNKDGRTPLSWAAGEGFADVVEKLVHYPDVEVNSTCNSGRTPLSYAASYADSNVIDLLLAHEKIDADARDATGRTPLSWAASGLEVYSFSALYRQIASASPSQAPQLPFGSLKLGSTTTTQQMTSAQLNVGGLTFPLTSTALNARASTPSHSLHQTLLSLLKHKDVNVNSRDNAGQTPLSWAVQQRCTLAVAVLLLHPKIDAKLADNNGFTPEWHALDLGYQEILSMLRREKKVSLAAEDHPISTVRVAAISKPNFSVGAFSVRWDTVEKEGEQARLVTVDEEEPSVVDGEEQPM